MTMLSITAATCKQCRKNTYKWKNRNADLYVFSFGHVQSRSKHAFRTSPNLTSKHWSFEADIKLFSTTALARKSEKNNYGYDSVLSAALDQSNALIAQTLTDNTMKLLRQGKPELAWECYKDLTSQHNQRYLTRDQYNNLVSKFSHQRNNTLALESVLTLVEDMKNLGYIVGRKERLMMIKLLGQNGMIKEMERVFEDLKRDQLLIVSDETQNVKAFNVITNAYEEQVKVLGSEEVAGKLIKLYQDMLDHNIKPNAKNTAVLLDRIRSVGYKHGLVEDVFKWIQPKLAETDCLLDQAFYDGLVYYFSNAGKPQYALEINDFMTENNIPRGLYSMTALIHKVGRAGDIERSMQLFEELVDVENHEPTLVTYNVLIDIHAHKKPEADIEGANRMYDLLRDAKHNPDIFTFGALIDMFAKKGDKSMLRRVYEYMRRRKNIESNEYIASSIVECFLKLEDTDYAFKALLYFRRNGMKTGVMWNIIFRDLVNTGKVKQAYRLLSMINTDLGPTVTSFLPLLNYYAYKGDPKGTRAIASLLSQCRMPITSQVYLALLKAYGKVQDTVRAEQIFDEYKANFIPDIFAYNSLLYAYAKNNEMDKVFETYSTISKANVKLNEATFGTLMYFYSKRRDIAAVESILEQMKQYNITPSLISRTILMQTYFECNRVADAKMVMEQMLQDNIMTSAQTWSIFINGCAKSDDLEFADSVLLQAVEKSLNNAPVRQNMLQNASNLLIFNKQPYAATVPLTIEDLLYKEDQASRVEHDVLSPHLFNSLIHAHIEKANFDRAKDIFNDMVKQNVEVTVPAYVTLMHLFKNSEQHEAVETMWNALQSPESYQNAVRDIDPRIPYIPVPEKKYSFLHMLHVSQQNTIEIRDFPEDAIPEQSSNFALSVYMDSLISQDRNEELIALWGRLSDEGYDFDEHNWNSYLFCLLTENRLDEACRLTRDNLFSFDSTEGDGNSKRTKTVKKTQRSRDKLDIDISNQLHDRICFVFGIHFQIPGIENMGVHRLRTLVLDRIKRHCIENELQEQQ
ncbi:hypothetical protein BY458DRAFT_190324 [Sporodiniella umbellata]|nr:hypothetical protein BY458DRAFT_190324 [Sporodiniella umbellata]